ncbi:MAG: RNHCP domain-containing protein [Patescibacteria group bacterium]
MRDKNSTNSGFVCLHCGRTVQPAPKTARNHCPYCLWSLHIDAETPGDRASKCLGQMEPVALFQKRDGWVVIHRCEKCGKEIQNKCAEDDSFETLLDLTSYPK